MNEEQRLKGAAEAAAAIQDPPEVSGGALQALFVDDDPEIIEQCQSLLPSRVGGEAVEWTFVESFEMAKEKLSQKRFDVLVTDVYKGRHISNRLGVGENENHAKFLVEAAKESGFSLVVLYSDGPRPDGLLSSPSIQFVDKSSPRPSFPASVVDVLARTLQERGRSLEIVNKIRRELDRATGAYIWDFIDENWEALKSDANFEKDGLERLIRRRAAILINESIGQAGFEERAWADKYDYYVCPPLPGDLRLGTVLKEANTNRYFVVLTPHCLLASQMKKGKPVAPKADAVLLAECVEAKTVIDPAKVTDKLSLLRIPARAGAPDGRLCFLPGFVSLPDLYCDLMKLSSVPLADALGKRFERVVVIDSPFAEAIQASLTRLYASVGNRNLQDSEFPLLFESRSDPRSNTV